MRRRLANAALVLTSTLGALLIAELVLRLTDDALNLGQEGFAFRWMVYEGPRDRADRRPTGCSCLPASRLHGMVPRVSASVAPYDDVDARSASRQSN